MKQAYLDIIEKSMAGYPEIPELAKLDTTDDIQAYARITAVVTILAVKGRWPDHLEIAKDMLSVCLRSLFPDNRLNDYAVKDIMIAYKYLRDVADPETLAIWQSAIRAIDPDIHYVIFENTKYKGHIHNVNVYNMAAENLRKSEGLLDNNDFIERHMERQLGQIDENGMYHDPNDPLLYDLTTRVQFLYLLGYGYDGRFRDRLDESVRRGALMSLRIQSAAFELPYGGRSAQYLFNEALVCSMAEYEAARYKSEGDLRTAGMFKRCARLSRESISRWLEVDPPRHIKNFFPTDTKAGTETYGYYNKYMASLGIFLHIALEWCDETIEEVPCPAELGGYIVELPKFHKIMANCGGYSIEIDTNADYNYDATGIGRIHRAGVPTELAISVPFSRVPKYTLIGDGADMSLSAGWVRRGEHVWMSEKECKVERYELIPILESEEQVIYELVYHLARGVEHHLTVRERHSISERGIHIDVETGEDTVCYRVPLLVTNGRDIAETTVRGDTVRTTMGGYSYTVRTSGDIKISESMACNRNGAYKSAILSGRDGRLSLDLSLAKE